MFQTGESRHRLPEKGAKGSSASKPRRSHWCDWSNSFQVKPVFQAFIFKMRLLNTKTRKLEEFSSEPFPRYAILSHTWDQRELSLHDLNNDPSVEARPEYQKVRYLCDQALQDGLSYAWLDTCCVDKASSAELSESINSMWRWYRNADMCYAYLPDVPDVLRKWNPSLMRMRTLRTTFCPTVPPGSSPISAAAGGSPGLDTTGAYRA